MKQSYLVQRGTFKTNKKAEVTGIDSLIDYDYMGRAEFEFGALGHSCKAILKNLDNYGPIRAGLPQTKDERSLWIVCADQDVAEARANVLGIYEKKIRLIEPSYLQEVMTGALPSYMKVLNVWWDLENHFLFCLGKHKDEAELILNAFKKVKAKQSQSK